MENSRKIKKAEFIPQRSYRIKNHDGETNLNTHGSLMKIIKTINSSEVVIEFEDGFVTHDAYSNFKKGLIKNPFDKIIYGVGYLGEEYIKNKSLYKLQSYKRWRDLLYRCYSNKEDFSSYKDCFVCKEWLNYSNFKKWFDANYYEIEGENVHLDKDILCYGNNVYSPETCMFVPQIFNQIFQAHSRNKTGMKTGVRKDHGKYYASISNNISKKREGSKAFETEEEAYEEYLKMKRRYMNDVLNIYKEKIPEHVYNALKKKCEIYTPIIKE